MKAFLGLALILLGVALVHGATCPGPNWVLNNGRCYWFNNDDNLAQYQADERCRRWNGHLVSINDIEENEYVFDNFPSDSMWAYTGLNDMDVEDEFRWVDGNLKLEWAGNFPQNYRSQGRYDCVVMSTGATGDGTWKEVQCNEKWPFICEAAAE